MCASPSFASSTVTALSQAGSLEAATQEARRVNGLAVGVEPHDARGVLLLRLHRAAVLGPRRSSANSTSTTS
jgi:hypothetical protein